MAKLIDHVEPGDLIRADMWNDLVDAVNELLGSTEDIKILDISPKGTNSDPIHLGDIVQITGRNFGHTAHNTSINFDNAPTGKITIQDVDLMTGSTDERLIFLMPEVPNLPRSGLSMVLRVNNGIADDIRTVMVMPRQFTLDGDIFVDWNPDIDPNPNPNPIQTEQVTFFAFLVQTAINMPAVISLNAEIQKPTATLPVGYTGKIQFLAEDGKTVITSKSLEMGKSETRKIFVLLPELPKEFAKQSFSLVVRGSAGGLTGTFSQKFTVGEIVPDPDSSITASLTGTQLFNPQGNTDTNPANGSFDGTVIRTKPDYQLVLAYSLTLTDTNDYVLECVPDANTKDWQPGPVNTPTLIPGPVTGRVVRIGVKPLSSATASGSIIFRIKKPDSNKEWFREINVRLSS